MSLPWLIAGGGISGLSAALALQQLGFAVKLFERYSESKPAGAGIILAPNALEALRRLNPLLKERAFELGRPCSELRIVSDQGDMLASMPTKEFGPSVALTRAELYCLLLEGLPTGTVTFGRKVEEVKYMSEHPVLVLDNGEEWGGEAVLACDGIHSTLRKQLAPPSELRYAGYTCWRGIASVETKQPYFSETWGASGRFGVVPLKKGRVYWYALINAPERDPRAVAMNAKDLLERFAGFHDPIPQILQQAQQDGLLHTDIADREPLGRFAYERVLFMGDAAHAMTPNLGQGACQALEDAAALADCLRQESLPQIAFQRFERLRQARVRQIAADSYRMGKIAQLSNPVLCRIRDLAMRLTPESLSNRQARKLYRMP